MNDLRTKIVSAIAVSIVIPMLIVLYLVARWSSGSLDSPGTIILLFLLALVLVGGGANILRSIGPVQQAAAQAPEEKPAEPAEAKPEPPAAE